MKHHRRDVRQVASRSAFGSVRSGKTRKGDRVCPVSFAANLLQSNNGINGVWKNDGFAALLSTAWYADIIRVQTIMHSAPGFAYIRGQVMIEHSE